MWTRLAPASLHNAYHLSLRQLGKTSIRAKFLLSHEKVEEPLVLRSEIASAVRDEGWADGLAKVSGRAPQGRFAAPKRATRVSAHGFSMQWQCSLPSGEGGFDLAVDFLFSIVIPDDLMTI